MATPHRAIASDGAINDRLAVGKKACGRSTQERGVRLDRGALKVS
jgi:hypothetical protein